MRYTIEDQVFEMFPEFRRGVVVATGVDNCGAGLETATLLAETVSKVPPVPTEAEKTRISAWNAAYVKFGADPNRFTPSVRFLHEQIRRGKPPRSINKLVDIMNSTSIKWIAPCGGDDLDSLDAGDLSLGIARGDESLTFAPLFKPSAIESVSAGEVVYFTPQTRRVMCRRWTWRNADFSKLTPQTKSVAINIDVMIPPLNADDFESAIGDVEQLVIRFCGGKVTSYRLTPTNPTVQITL